MKPYDKFPTGPHKITVPKGQKLEIKCGNGTGDCTVKWIFRWQAKEEKK